MDQNSESFHLAWTRGNKNEVHISKTITISLQHPIVNPHADTVLASDAEDHASSISPTADTIISDSDDGLELNSGSPQSFLSSAPIRNVNSEVAEHNDYTIDNKIAMGGQGIIYAAEQTSLGRTVALKTQRPDLAQTNDKNLLFVSEAEITGALEHPNIVPIYELGRDQSGSPFYTMKMVNGKSWDRLVPKFSLEKNLEILQSIADGMAYAHAQGFVHCDLKPANIMIGEHGEHLIVDWGLALRRSPEDTEAKPVAPNAQIGGTPAYMPPELARIQTQYISQRTDVYLLGAMLFNILTGETPHSGKNINDCMLNAGVNHIEIPKTCKDKELLSIALKAMETDPNDRWADAHTFKKALQEFNLRKVSKEFTSKAQGLCNEAKSDLLKYSKALHSLDEAAALWADNPHIKSVNQFVRTKYASEALRQKNPRLCLSLLEHQKGFGSDLIEQAQHYIQEEKFKQKRYIIATTIAILTAILVPIVMTTVTVQSLEEQEKSAAALVVAQQAQQCAETKSYYALIAQAESARRQLDYARARTLLDQCPEHMRNWEWTLLKHATNGSHYTVSIPGLRPKHICWFNDNPHELLITDRSGELIICNYHSGEILKRFDSGIPNALTCKYNPMSKSALIFNHKKIAEISLHDGTLSEPIPQWPADKNLIDVDFFNQGLAYIFAKEAQLYVTHVEAPITLDKPPTILHSFNDDLYIGFDKSVHLLKKGGQTTEPYLKSEYPIEFINNDQKKVYAISGLRRSHSYFRRRLLQPNQNPTSLNNLTGNLNSGIQMVDGDLVYKTNCDRGLLYLDLDNTEHLQQSLFANKIESFNTSINAQAIATAHQDVIHVTSKPPDKPLNQINIRKINFYVAMHSHKDHLYGLSHYSHLHKRDIKTGALLESYEGRKGALSSYVEASHIDTLKNGDLFVSTGRTLSTYNQDGKKTEIRSPGKGLPIIMSCRIHPNGQFAAIAPRLRAIEVWDVVNQNRLYDVILNDGRPTFIKALCWSHKGDKLVAIDGARQVICYDVTKKQEVWRQKVHYRPYNFLSHERGAVLALGQQVIIFDWEDGSMKRLRSHQSDIQAFCINKTRNYLLTSDAEGWLSFWNLNSLDNTLNIKISSQELFTISSEGDYINFSGQDMILHNWNLAPITENGASE